jgi:DNA-binding transcriptional regulator LsrR (DeoR family)
MIDRFSEREVDMERLSMRMIREVLRLKFECGLSDRQIAKSTGIARSSIGD